MAALLRRFARSSRNRPSRISVVITPAASKYVSASKPPISTTVDHVQAESVPSEISVSMFAAPWRPLASAARWKPRPLQKTTGVASANASHSQPENWSAEIIPSRTSGTVRTIATASRRPSASSAWSCSWPASCGCAR